MAPPTKDTARASSNHGRRGSGSIAVSSALKSVPITAAEMHPTESTSLLPHGQSPDIRRRAGQGSSIKGAHTVVDEEGKAGGKGRRTAGRGKGDWTLVECLKCPKTTASFLILIALISIFHTRLTPPGWTNWAQACLQLSHELPGVVDSKGRTVATGGVDGGTRYYAKGPKDLLFLAYYTIVFFCIRSSLTLYILRPLGQRVIGMGLKPANKGEKMRPRVVSESKMNRFLEQGYAGFYWGSSAVLGLIVMRSLPIWYFKTEYFFLEYPIWRMSGILKAYYLLQFAYWTQQIAILALQIEKPRDDFMELVIHHAATIWLIGGSYVLNYTYCGVAVFITMDASDVFLAVAKMINYCDLDLASAVAFGIFTAVWTYGRHYLNLWILWSMWYEFSLIPAEARHWAPFSGFAAPGWMRYQMFAPLALLQLINIFWSYRIWRILVKAIRGVTLADDRESGEEDEEDEKVEGAGGAQ